MGSECSQSCVHAFAHRKEKGGTMYCIVCTSSSRLFGVRATHTHTHRPAVCCLLSSRTHTTPRGSSYAGDDWETTKRAKCSSRDKCRIIDFSVKRDRENRQGPSLPPLKKQSCLSRGCLGRHRAARQCYIGRRSAQCKHPEMVASRATLARTYSSSRSRSRPWQICIG